MSFSGKRNLPAEPPKLGGIDPNQTSTNETARVVPYLAGRNIIGVTFLGEAFDVRADPVYQETKKDPILSGYNYYASFVVLVCLGAVGKLTRVYFEEDLVWEGELVRAGDSEDFSIEGRCNATIYWGTETQGIDPTLAASDQNHPAYRGQCIIVFKDCLIGYNRTSLGNIKVVVERLPAPAFLSAAGRENVIGDANVPAIIHDWITNARCLHLPESRLDTDDLADQADTLFSECLGVSPVVTRATGARELLVELLEYVDGFMRTTPAGKLTIGLVRETPCADITLAFDETDLAELPAMEPEDWDTTFNKVAVNFSNRDNHYQADPAQGESAANRQITGGVRQKTYERRWFTRQLAAQTFANILASRLGQPGGGGRLLIRKSRLQGLQPGDVFRFSYAPDALCHLLCRCIEVNRPSPDRPVVEVLYEVDRGNLAAQFFAPPEIEPPPPPDYTPQPITSQAILELPHSARIPRRGEWLLWLAARPTKTTTRALVHKQRPSSSYEQVSEVRRFAFHGTLDAAYPIDTEHVDNSLGLSITFTGIDTDLSALTSLTADDATENPWLLSVNGELLSVFGATLLAPGQYRLYAIRARADTCREAHAEDDEVWLFQTAGAGVYETGADETPQTYKFQPSVFGRLLDLADATALSVAITKRGLRPYRPLNLRAFGDRHPSYATAQDIEFTWNNTLEARTDAWSNITTDLPSTEIDILTLAGVVVGTLTAAAGETSAVYVNADLRVELGTEQTFKARAYHVRDGLRSVCYSEITVELTGAGSSSGSLIPCMLSNTSPAGTVFGTNSYSWLYSNFDCVWDAGGNSWALATLPIYIGYQFATGQVATRYTLYMGRTISCSWVLEGSNDGSSWTTLDTRTNEGPFGGLVGKSYTFTNVTSYTHYRWTFTAATGALVTSEFLLFAT
jgi:hypothetical protein